MHSSDDDGRREADGATTRVVSAGEAAPAAGDIAASLVEVQDGWLGVAVGPYRLLGRVGQGGMGSVYKAVRDDDQFKKTVAIKLLRVGVPDPLEQQRFRAER